MTERHEARAREMVRAIYQQEPQEHEAKEIAAWFRAVEAEALERAAQSFTGDGFVPTGVVRTRLLALAPKED